MAEHQDRRTGDSRDVLVEFLLGELGRQRDMIYDQEALALRCGWRIEQAAK